MAKRKHKATLDAIQILYRRYYEGRPERVRGLEEARANDSVARKLTARSVFVRVLRNGNWLGWWGRLNIDVPPGCSARPTFRMIAFFKGNR